MNPNDDKLKALLRRWPDIESRASFEANVRRRIRLAQANEPARAGWLAWLWPQWQPKLALAAAVIVSVIVGSTYGLRSAPRSTVAVRGELQFMSSGTLAGGYARLGTEARR